MTPMLFMGQEWAAGTPFLFFSDHHEALGRLVTEGRRREFGAWNAFGDTGAATIPDPQASETFQASRLRWEEREREPHASVLRLYRALLTLRRQEPALQWAADAKQEAYAPSDAPESASVVLVRRRGDAAFATVCCLRGAGSVDVNLEVRAGLAGPWEVVLTSEDREFAADPHPVAITPATTASDAAARGHLRLAFARPGAVLLRTVPGGA